MAHLIAFVVSVILLALLALPPLLALYMLVHRLRNAHTEGRMPLQALVALTGIVLVFNLLVWSGMPRAVLGFLPDLIDRNLVITGLLCSWAAAGLCLMLVVLAPIRRRSSSNI